MSWPTIDGHVIHFNVTVTPSKWLRAIYQALRWTNRLPRKKLGTRNQFTANVKTFATST
jgi:hypothetical protein